MLNVQNVVKNLIKEIHQICINNKIEYFLADELALLAYKNNDISNSCIVTGRIFMTANNIKKFILCCEKISEDNRAIEWMGNNGNFPGMFVRYIDTSTTCYTPERLLYEKYLGIYVTIELLRPKGATFKYYQVREKAYENIIKKKETTGRKLEPILRFIYLKNFKKKGREKYTKNIFEALIKTYSRNNYCREYWTKGENGTIKYYTADLFKKNKIIRVGDTELCVSMENIQLLRVLYGANLDREYVIEKPKNNMDFFCDSQISYKELNLSQYTAIIEKIMNQDIDIKRKLRKYKNRKIIIVNRVFNLYYKFYFSSYLLEKINQIEDLYEKKEFKKLDVILRPYVNVMKKYGYIHISDRVTLLIESLYGIKVKHLFKGVAKEDKENIVIGNDRSYYKKI